MITKHDSTVKQGFILLPSKRLPVLKLKARRKQGVSERFRCHDISQCTDNPVASCNVAAQDINDRSQARRFFRLAFALF
jgi:hypothetical protein